MKKKQTFKFSEDFKVNKSHQFKALSEKTRKKTKLFAKKQKHNIFVTSKGSEVKIIGFRKGDCKITAKVLTNGSNSKIKKDDTIVVTLSQIKRNKWQLKNE